MDPLLAILVGAFVAWLAWVGWRKGREDEAWEQSDKTLKPPQ